MTTSSLSILVIKCKHKATTPNDEEGGEDNFITDDEDKVVPNEEGLSTEDAIKDYSQSLQ